ncbi:MAG: LamG domain-containing protein, partial [Candidatus Poribacteria bacterium]|nr:LamG domain-containing protein [Candidatus Poribacteria bacterium]
RIRFTPTNDGVFQNGHTIIKLRIWDGTTDQPGTICDASEFGGTMSLSAEEISAKIEILSGPPVAGFGSALWVTTAYGPQYVDDDDNPQTPEQPQTGIVVNNAGAQITDMFTMECWVNPNAVADITNSGNSGYDPLLTNGSLLAFRTETGDTLYNVYIGKTYYESDSYYMSYSDIIGDWNTEILEMGKWIHVALTIDSLANVRMYVNGILWGFGETNPASNSNSSLLIGSGVADGMIDEVRLWNVVRSETEIRESMYRLLAGTEEGLVGYWRFDALYIPCDDGDCPGQTPDATAFANDGLVLQNPYTQFIKSHVWSSEPDLYFTNADRGSFIQFGDSHASSLDIFVTDSVGLGSSVIIDSVFTMGAWVYRSKEDSEGTYISGCRSLPLLGNIRSSYFFGYQGGNEIVMFEFDDDGSLDWHTCT